MGQANQELEEQCEDAVFQICCTRERYSVRCANQLEKHLALVTKRKTAEVRRAPAPKFEVPVTTEGQQELFNKFNENQNRQSNPQDNVKSILNRLKELKSIVTQIEKSKHSEIHQLLQQ